MKKKALMGLIATATLGSAMVTPAIISNQNISHDVNNILMVNNDTSAITNEAVVINGNSSMKLYGLSNGSGIVSNLSTGEMLTILGQAQKGYCKVRVQATGAIGYINTANMQNILNGTNTALIILSENGQVINVSSNVRLRSNPSINASIIGHLTNGTNLNILGKQGQWYKVEVDGQTGFIYGEYISANGSNVANSNSQSSTTSNSSSQGSTSELSNSNTSSNLTTSSIGASATSNANSSSHAKNIIVGTKSSSNSSSLSNNKSNTGNDIKVNNSNNIVVTNSDIQKGLYSNAIFEEALKKGINSNTLTQLIFNSLSPTIKNKYNNQYNCLSTLQENIILNGTKEQKQYLLNAIGNRIIINVTADKAVPLISANGVNETPSNYTNGTFYYDFSITTLKNLCDNINNWGQYNGLISKDGVFLSNSEINTLIENKEIYTITNGEVAYPAYKNEYNFNNTTLEGNTNNLSPNSNDGSTQHAPGAGAHVNNMNNGSPTSVGSSSGKVEIIAPNTNSSFPLSTVIVKNNTGKPISDSDLNSVMRNWILKWQFNREMFCVATGENWAPQWLNTIPNSELINAFIEANGKEALSKNITANEINKAAMLFTQQANQKEPPFTIAQATKYIQEMLNQSNYDQTITKIVPHLNDNDGGLYYVYTKPFNSKGRSNPFWYVYTNTGQATGV